MTLACFEFDREFRFLQLLQAIIMRVWMLLDQLRKLYRLSLASLLQTSLKVIALKEGEIIIGGKQLLSWSRRCPR